MSRRTEKVADLIQTTLAELIARRVKDPAVAEAMVSITRVDVSPDLATARVHVSLLAPDDVDAAEVIEALARAAPFLHREMSKEFHMRRVPRVQFVPDSSIAEGDRITRLMREVAREEGRDL